MENKLCSGCGTAIEDAGETYQYCTRCEVERLDDTIPSLVWEYICGRRGDLPNVRNIDYFIRRNDYQHYGVIDGFNIYIAPNQVAPNGNIAIAVRPDLLVVVNGKQELASLMNSAEFKSGKLPARIEAADPDAWEHIQDARRKAGMI